MQHARFALDSKITTDAKRRIFRFDNNRLRFNEMTLAFDGTVSRQGQELVTDLSFDTGRTGFKSLLSLFPAVSLSADFDSLQTDGHFMMDGFVKGTFDRKQKPCISLHLQVDSGMFKYPRLPEAADNIQLAVNLLYDGAAFDRSTIDIDRFHLEPGGRPFDLNLHVKTPQSDMQVAGGMKGSIRFDSLAYVIPMNNMQLTGFMECDLSLDGRMSALEKEPFEHFQAQGMLELMDITLTNARFPEGVDIPNLSVNFTPRVVKMLKSMMSGLKKQTK
jgi:hypothetical protein